MAEFLKDTQLVAEIEHLIEDAEAELRLITPYIKLHERVKATLNRKKDNPDLHLVVVFGKNEEDASKSLSKEDFEFLKGFPCVTIGYEKRLHAKYYASESFSIIMSMNLHEFSQNNNIEVGIKLKNKLFSSDSADTDAAGYFEDVLNNCTIIFDKVPQFKSGIIGSTYTHFEVQIDEAQNFFSKREVVGKKYHQRKPQERPKQSPPQQGFCIRTGNPIPFDLKRPMCYEAFQSCNQYKNMDFKEKFCHKTGKPSFGKTSMRNPVLY